MPLAADGFSSILYMLNRAAWLKCVVFNSDFN